MSLRFFICLQCLKSETLFYICCMIQDTQQAIVEAAIAVFNEDLSAPLEKVADRAGITRRTLHRYFKDRKELMASCEAEMQKACFVANVLAYNASDEPMQRLENMFYAGLNCGIKGSFLNKLHSSPDHKHQHKDKNCAEFDKTVSLWKSHLIYLQENGLISKQLSICWINTFFQSVISATISSQAASASDTESTRKFAWYSFSRGIGL
jgi:AcrR family transcriptional regulator